MGFCCCFVFVLFCFVGFVCLFDLFCFVVLCFLFFSFFFFFLILVWDGGGGDFFLGGGMWGVRGAAGGIGDVLMLFLTNQYLISHSFHAVQSHGNSHGQHRASNDPTACL